MNRQKGQSVVEFALIIPLFLILIMGMIYGAFAYADYMQCTTSVREAARNIAIQKDAQKREQKKAALLNKSYTPALYKAKLYTENYTAEVHEPDGTNTGYVTDPEECMADNFAYAMLYGMKGKDGKGYPNPEIIQGIIDYLKQ